MPEGLPKWVEKLFLQLMNLAMPKIRLRPGMKPTPDKIGVFIGSELVQIEHAKAMMALPPPQTEAQRAGFAKGISLLPDPEIFTALKASNGVSEMEPRVKNIISRVLNERPLNDVSEFFRGFARGLKRSNDSLLPKIVDGKASYTPKQFEKIRTLMIYSVAAQRWQQIDSQQTSREAYDFLAKFLPPEILGFDPERIRKMFYRLGKKFKDGGRPIKKE